MMMFVFLAVYKSPCLMPGRLLLSYNVIIANYNTLLSAYEHILKVSTKKAIMKASGDRAAAVQWEWRLHKEKKNKIRHFLLRCLVGSDCKSLFMCLCETLGVIIELGWTRPMTRPNDQSKKVSGSSLLGWRLEMLPNPAGFDHCNKSLPTDKPISCYLWMHNIYLDALRLWDQASVHHELRDCSLLLSGLNTSAMYYFRVLPNCLIET